MTRFLLIFAFLSISSSIVTLANTVNPYRFFNPLFDSTYVSFSHQYAVFNGYANQKTQPHFFVSNVVNSPNNIAHPPQTVVTYDETPEDFVKFEMIELHGSLSLGSHINFAVSAPYHFNSSYYSRVIEQDGVSQIKDSAYHFSGIGKIMSSISYTFVLPHLHFKQIIAPSFGTNMLSHVLKPSSINRNEDQTMIPGALTPDKFIGLNYTLIRKENDLNIWVLFGWSDPNDKALQPGNLVNSGVNFNHEIEFSKFKLKSSIGVTYDQSEKHLLYGDKLSASGGHRLGAQLAILLSHKKYFFKTEFNKPVIEQINGNQFKMAGRISTSLAYTLF